MYLLGIFFFVYFTHFPLVFVTIVCKMTDMKYRKEKQHKKKKPEYQYKCALAFKCYCCWTVVIVGIDHQRSHILSVNNREKIHNNNNQTAFVVVSFVWTFLACFTTCAWVCDRNFCGLLQMFYFIFFFFFGMLQMARRIRERINKIHTRWNVWSHLVCHKRNNETTEKKSETIQMTLWTLTRARCVLRVAVFFFILFLHFVFAKKKKTNEINTKRNEGNDHVSHESNWILIANRRIAMGIRLFIRTTATTDEWRKTMRETVFEGRQQYTKGNGINERTQIKRRRKDTVQIEETSIHHLFFLLSFMLSVFVSLRGNYNFVDLPHVCMARKCIPNKCKPIHSNKWARESTFRMCTHYF